MCTVQQFFPVKNQSQSQKLIGPQQLGFSGEKKRHDAIGIHSYIHSIQLPRKPLDVIVICTFNCCTCGIDKHSKELLIEKASTKSREYLMAYYWETCLYDVWRKSPDLAFRSYSLQQCDPQKAWSGLLLELPYHVVPDSPLMYVIQSRRFNFLSPMRLPYNPVIDFSPPPVVMIATTGTCWAEGGWDIHTDSIQHHIPHCSGVWSPQPAQVLFQKERLQNEATTATAPYFPLDKHGFRD